MSKKNIDDLFRGKFKDFGEVPDDKVWSSIEASLDRKKKNRKAIPIWWRLGGVAAILAVLFYVVNPFGGDKDTGTIISETESKETQKTDDGDSIEKKGDILNDFDVEKEQVASSDDEGENDKRNGDPDKTKGQSSIAPDTEESIANTSVQQQNPLKNKDAKKQGITSVDPKKIENPNGEKDNLEEISRKKNEGVAILDNAKKEGVKDVDEIKNQKNTVSDNPILERKSPDEAVVQTDEKQIDSVDTSKKKSIFDDIKEEEESIAENNRKKWSVGPSVAPVYFDSFGEGSPIHSNFVANSKSGNINLSYGVAVSYEVSNKLSIRSGIHKVDYGYDTNEVLFSSSLTASTNGQIDNISYTANAKNLVVESSIGNENAAPETLSSDVVAAKNPSRSGRMVQEFGYLEIPVELNYALMDKKLGVNLIGGISSLFLTDNSVTLESDGTATEMGEANNINDVNFSTNIGVGINYKVTPKVQLNLEPMFKYQLNTFSNTDGSFQPFSIGVYSGLNFRF